MLNTADVCVNPDVANEMNDKSTMNKIMEYMALGKPIVQFDLTEGRFSAQARRRCMQDGTTAWTWQRRSFPCSMTPSCANEWGTSDTTAYAEQTRVGVRSPEIASGLRGIVLEPGAGRVGTISRQSQNSRT